jgi:hypothetical protein
MNRRRRCHRRRRWRGRRRSHTPLPALGCHGRGLTRCQYPGELGRGMFRIPSSHLACRVAVEINACRTRHQTSQIHDAPGVNAKGHTPHAPLNGRAALPEVGGDPDLQRSVRLVFLQHEGLRVARGKVCQGGVYVLLRNRHPALHRGCLIAEISTPPCPRPYFVAAEIADAVGQTFVRDNFQNRQLARGEVRPSLKALGKGLDTVSMPNERTHAYLPRDAHPTGDGPAGSIKSDQGKPCKSWKVRDPPPQVRSTQQLYSSAPCGQPDRGATQFILASELWKLLCD